MTWRRLRLLVGAGIVGALFWSFGFDQIGAAVRDVRVGQLAIYAGLAVAATVAYSARWLMVSRAVGSRPSLAGLVAARLAGDAVGSLVPSAKLAGEPVRIALLRAQGISGARASAGVALDRMLEMTGNMLCVVAYIAVFSATRALGSTQWAAVLLLLAMLAGLAGLAVPLVMLRRGQRPLARLYGARRLMAIERLAAWLVALRRTEDHLLEFFRDRAAVFVWGIAASLAIEALVLCEYHFLLAGFGVDTDLPTLLLVLLGSGVARAAPTPAGLGALETGQVAALTLAMGHPETGFVVGMVLRLHETIWMALGLVVLSAQGLSLASLRAAAVPKEV